MYARRYIQHCVGWPENIISNGLSMVWDGQSSVYETCLAQCGLARRGVQGGVHNRFSMVLAGQG